MYEAKFYETKEGREVRYWSVFQQVWRTARQVEDIPDNEYAAMTNDDRDKIIAFLDNQPVLSVNPDDIETK